MLAGLREHRSQAHVVLPVDTGQDEFVRGTTHETHVLVWPPPTPGRVLSDVFEDL